MYRARSLPSSNSILGEEERAERHICKQISAVSITDANPLYRQSPVGTQQGPRGGGGQPHLAGEAQEGLPDTRH